MEAGNFHKYTNNLVALLNKRGFDAHVTRLSSGGSGYIKFRSNTRMGSIRISDHEGDPRYRYMFNIRGDISKSYINKDTTSWQYFFPIDDLEGLYKALQKRLTYIETYV